MTHITPIQKLFKTIKESAVGRSVKGVGVGVYDVGKDGYDGVVDTFKDPFGTYEALKEAASHPIQTSTFIVNSISDSYESDMVNGTAESRSHWVTYALGTTATAVFGTKGVGTVSKTGAAPTKAAVQKSVTATQNALQSLKTLELPQILPYTPRLELALPDSVPFKVADGNKLKKDLILQAEKYSNSGVDIKQGNVKSNPKTDHIIKGDYKLKPSIKYTSNGYHYSTDHLGRIDNVKGKLQLDQAIRNSTHQIKAGGENRKLGDHGGHLIAHIFGGSGLIDNMVPMNGKLLNQGTYRKLEIAWKKALERGGEVNVSITPKYKGNSLRPNEIVVNYTVDGKNMRARLSNP